MSRESHAEMVQAYDTRTGDKVRVAKAWIGSRHFPHLSLTPSARAKGTPDTTTNTPKGD